MKVIIDIEANALRNPTQIWLIVCKDISTGELHIFRNLTENVSERTRFLQFADSVTQWIGHNVLGYDALVMRSLLGCNIEDKCIDTLIISKLIAYSRPGHSIEQYGEEFGFGKGNFHKWNDPSLHDQDSELSKELLTYCIRDVEITLKVYYKYLKDIYSTIDTNSITFKDNILKLTDSVLLEHKFQLLVNQLEANGFSFNAIKANKLLEDVKRELDILDLSIQNEFPPREVLLREFSPKATKHGTISRTSVPRALHPLIHTYEIGKSYRHTARVPFNPGSHKQVVEVLNEAGWQPIEKTVTHLETERELSRLKYRPEERNQLDFENLSAKLVVLRSNGWKVNETNLNTLPPTAPSPARSLAKRILLESRRRTLTEWLGLVDPDTSRIYGKFYGIGAWTHRMAHQKPNTANIPSPTNLDGSTKLLGKEMRSLWQAPRNRLLVGVDAEGIQLRIFAHYIEDEEFTNALVRGKKADKTDPHSLNQRILGKVCKTRQSAKRFVYALLLGGGLGKLAQILECSREEAAGALENLMARYQGFTDLKKNRIPHDAKRGWFSGIDLRRVPIPGETASERRHLCMSGYLQNGEVIIMKRAAILFDEHPEIIYLRRDLNKRILFVNMVHDEDQYETPNSMDVALKVANIQTDCIRYAGEIYNLKCPMAGSFYNEDTKDYTIGTNWYSTH